MRKIYSVLILSLFIWGGSVQAQSQPEGFHLDKRINMAAILSTKPSLASGFSSVSEARTIINDIMNVADQQQNFQVLSTTQVDNAAAVTYQNQRYILYNPSFINKLDKIAKDEWASISVLAHEIGHHLLGHTVDGRGSVQPKELSADEFSGIVLRRMGATLQQAQLAMQLISSPYASATHPAQKDRLTAIARGWNSTSGRTKNDDIAINQPNEPIDRQDQRTYPYPQERNTYPADPRNRYPSTKNYPNQRNERNYPRQQQRRNTYPFPNRGNEATERIVYQLRFNNDRQQYFITDRNNVVKANRNRMAIVARIAVTNHPAYPYIIYDDRLQMRVDRNGRVLDDLGRTLGYIQR